MQNQEKIYWVSNQQVANSGDMGEGVCLGIRLKREIAVRTRNVEIFKKIELLEALPTDKCMNKCYNVIYSRYREYRTEISFLICQLLQLVLLMYLGLLIKC